MAQFDRDPSPYTELHEMVAAFCTENDLPFVDLRREFRGQVEADIWVHATDQHPNHIGHKLLGDGVLRFLRAQGLEPPR